MGVHAQNIERMWGFAEWRNKKNDAHLAITSNRIS